MMGLTATQLRALRFIDGYITSHSGVGPSRQDIADAMGWKSRSCSNRVVDELVSRGALRRLEGQRRGLEVLVSLSPAERRPNPYSSEVLSKWNAEDLTKLIARAQAIRAKIPALAQGGGE